jgi:pyruvate,water dikinase
VGKSHTEDVIAELEGLGLDPLLRHLARTGAAMKLVPPLASFGRIDVDAAGGKGANLGELIRAGFPVPAGFVVTTAAYKAVAAFQRSWAQRGVLPSSPTARWSPLTAAPGG